LKGVPASEVEEAGAVVGRVWCGQVDAEPSRQHVAPVSNAGGLMRYLALHFQKESQAPPIGWRGHRFTSSRGYFPLGAASARARAKESLRLGRAIWWANAVAEAEWLDGDVVLSGSQLDALVDGRLLEEAARSWSLKHVAGQSADPDVHRRRGARSPFARGG
jgi:hypothetical protein